MFCPKCSRELYDGAVKCSFCGVDIVQYEKLTNISNALYNKGLAQANKRNLSGAVLSLTESLRIDKNNTEARNLLGLVYFELGLIGDAIKHWIISINLHKEDNPAKRYLDDIQRHSKEYEQMNDAVRMYNRAIQYVEQDNDDMAIIQLKKALELNADFVDAINFLTFCHLIQQDSRAALPLIERTLSIDVDNETALRYYKTITGTKMKSASVVSKKPSGKETSHSELPFPAAKTVSTGKGITILNDILFFALGGICAIAVMYVLIIPDVVQRGSERAAELSAEISSLNDKYNADTASMDEQIQALETQIADLEMSISTQSEQINHYERIQVVSSAARLLENGNTLGAAEIIYTVDLEGLPVDILEQAQSIKTTSYTQAATTLYNDGFGKYGAKDYAGARDSLEKALKYATQTDKNVDNICYYLGCSERELGNNDEAIGYFKTVVDNYPNSAVFSKANSEMNRLLEG